MKEKRSVSKKVQDLIDEFQAIPADSLSLIAKNKVDAVELAKVELASRGLDHDGRWVGSGQLGSLDYPHPLASKKKIKAKEEQTLINVEKLVRLRNQIDKAIEIEEADKSKYDANKALSHAYQYHLGKLHSLNEFREKLNDLVIQG